jgi:hypothetical protein
MERSIRGVADKVLACLQLHPAHAEMSSNFFYNKLFLKFQGRIVTYPLHLHYERCYCVDDLSTSNLIHLDPNFIFQQMTAQGQAARPPRDDKFRQMSQWRHPGNWAAPAVYSYMTPMGSPMHTEAPPPHRQHSPPQQCSMEHVSQRARTASGTYIPGIGLAMGIAAPRQA